MAVQRIVANIATHHPGKVAAFYGGILGMATRGAKTNHELTFKLDHSVGTDHRTRSGSTMSRIKESDGQISKRGRLIIKGATTVDASPDSSA